MNQHCDIGGKPGTRQRVAVFTLTGFCLTCFAWGTAEQQYSAAQRLSNFAEDFMRLAAVESLTVDTTIRDIYLSPTTNGREVILLSRGNH